jgi:uncharacterized membrane protein YkvA (DUF1232 family)
LFSARNWQSQREYYYLISISLFLRWHELINEAIKGISENVCITAFIVAMVEERTGWEAVGVTVIYHISPFDFVPHG